MAGSHRKSKFAVAGITPHMKDSERTLIMQAKNKKTTRAKKTERNKRSFGPPVRAWRLLQQRRTVRELGGDAMEHTKGTSQAVERGS
jgi:hypothetical protein